MLTFRSRHIMSRMMGAKVTPDREFTPEQRLFLCLEKEKGAKYSETVELFKVKWPGKEPPTRQGLHVMRKKLHAFQTLQDRRSTASGGSKTVRTPANITAVNNLLSEENERNPDDIGSSCRRNDLNLSKSSFSRITKHDLKLHPYKLLRLQKVTPHHAFLRLKMGRILARKTKAWFATLCVSDEAWFTLGGYVYNRKNTVIYSPVGEGTPDQWFSEASQAQEKVMVFCLLHGSGKKFGPFFHAADENINQHSYRDLLQRRVFPQMKQKLGQQLFDQTVWQQDGAKPHQANMVMDWLDTIFGERMLAIRSRRGDSWAPSSPDLNPLDFFLWGYLKEKVYKPLPSNMMELKARIRRELRNLPDLLVSKAVFSMKRRATRVMGESGGAFEGKVLRL